MVHISALVETGFYPGDLCPGQRTGCRFFHTGLQQDGQAIRHRLSLSVVFSGFFEKGWIDFRQFLRRGLQRLGGIS